MSDSILELNSIKPSTKRTEGNLQGENLVMIGYGCVGEGVVNIINSRHKKDYYFSNIGVKNLENRSADFNFTNDIESLINSKNDYLLELIDDSDNALLYCLAALLKKKSVISANKKMIAENFKLLFDTHIENQVSFLYEGAVAGGIPIIRNLENYYGNERLKSISGIINGSSNYILSKMGSEGESFNTVLKKAQEIGFAESDPSLDIDGFDAKYKLCILAAHGFGVILDPNDVLSLGIRNISNDDLNYANNFNHKFKLIAQVYEEDSEVKAFVLPQLVDSNNELFHVENEFNAVQVNGQFSDQQTFIGKGAGSHPTGSAVVSDLNAAHSGYRYSYEKLAKNLNSGKAYKLFSNEGTIRCYISFTSTTELQDLHLSNETEIGTIGNKQYLIADLKIADLLNIPPSETKLFIARI